MNNTYILLKTEKEFIDTMKFYKSKWEIHMWELFKENTCYIPSEDCFISLEKAIVKNWTEL